ncbi:ROK family transcriptional regulator [Sphingobacterium oryzagri]|uniref:ROK family transcriptional regulator n=1 Tax=Sphingobacterium oryzagri TaxID=3025669 RepID=A0ABY7WGB0_9SPHI|nr:ROK family transcriptional regulator [Sphingobacterium sp. KACC 22765]WDF68198.1 ROK family transcriptional regulator [Sphingobacterium sp. KACC 22765]
MDSLKTAILKHLYFYSTQSIAEISEGIGKSIPLVTRAINELLEGGLVSDIGLRASTGGRRAMNFALNTEVNGCIIAVAIDQYSISIALSDLANRRLFPSESQAIELKNDRGVYAVLLAMLSATLSRVEGLSILAIGITIPGFVNAEKGINNSFAEGSPLFSLREHITEAFGIPTYIENDSSAIAIAEKYFGSARQVDDALVINFNWGVGLGMLIQGKLFRGHSGFAGEFSHIPLGDESKLCSCGKKGCLEVEASLHCAFDDIQASLANGERSHLEEVFSQEKGLQFEQLLIAYELGDQLTIRSIKKIAYMLGKGIATLIHILNPEKIIISGRGAAFGQTLTPQILSSIQEYCIPRLARHTALQVSELTDVQLLASACIAVQQLQWQPQHKLQLTKDI